MKAIMKNPNDKNILLVLNDNESDGTDVSWIWDAHFELLIDEHTKHIYCAGLRAYDMALRLKYEGFKDVEVVENTETDVDKNVSISEHRTQMAKVLGRAQNFPCYRRRKISKRKATLCP